MTARARAADMATRSPGAPHHRAAGGNNAGANVGNDGLPSGHVVAVELISTKDDVPVSVLELEIVPRPIIIDRTFR